MYVGHAIPFEDRDRFYIWIVDLAAPVVAHIDRFAHSAEALPRLVREAPRASTTTDRSRYLFVEVDKYVTGLTDIERAELNDLTGTSFTVTDAALLLTYAAEALAGDMHSAELGLAFVSREREEPLPYWDQVAEIRNISLEHRALWVTLADGWNGSADELDAACAPLLVA